MDFENTKNLNINNQSDPGKYWIVFSQSEAGFKFGEITWDIKR